LLIVVDSISLQSPITQLPVSAGGLPPLVPGPQVLGARQVLEGEVGARAREAGALPDAREHGVGVGLEELGRLGEGDVAGQGRPERLVLGPWRRACGGVGVGGAGGGPLLLLLLLLLLLFLHFLLLALKVLLDLGRKEVGEGGVGEWIEGHASQWVVPLFNYGNGSL